MSTETHRPQTDMPDRRGRPGRLPLEGSARITRRITTIAVCVGLILAIGKWFVWQESHSVGILSSLVHSALDLFGAISSFFAVRYAARPPDGEYRFGRGKAESFSAVFQVCLIVLGAFHLIEEVFHRVSHPEVLTQGGFAIAMMLVFIAIRFGCSLPKAGPSAQQAQSLYAEIAHIILQTYWPISLLF